MKKIKPVKAWAVFVDDWPGGLPATTCASRSIARYVSRDYIERGHKNVQIAHVEIRPITPNRKARKP